MQQPTPRWAMQTPLGSQQMPPQRPRRWAVLTPLGSQRMPPWTLLDRQMVPHMPPTTTPRRHTRL
jgi:hypothetical protein